MKTQINKEKVQVFFFAGKIDKERDEIVYVN